MKRLFITLCALILVFLWGHYIFKTGNILHLFFISGFVMLGVWAVMFHEPLGKLKKTKNYYICRYFTKRGERLRIIEEPTGTVLAHYPIKSTDYGDMVQALHALSKQLNIPVFREEDDYLE